MSNKKINKLTQEADARRKAFEAKQTEREAKSVQRRKDNRLAIVIAAVAVLLALGASFGRQAYDAANAPTPTATATASPTASAATQAPDPSVSESRTWNGQMLINTTGLRFTLDGKKAPQAVANFVTLVKKGFYRAISCHRLTTADIYVLQCGDPKGDGTGGPGYNWGPIENAPSDNVYKTGVLAMARVSDNGNSMGSQFFIVYKDSTIPSDNVGGYTVFGQVTQGIDNLVQNVVSQGVAGGGSDGAPTNTTAITFISVK